jgi:hypothetical protein
VLATLVLAGGLFWLLRRRRAELDHGDGRRPPTRDETPGRVE